MGSNSYITSKHTNSSLRKFFLSLIWPYKLEPRPLKFFHFCNLLFKTSIQSELLASLLHQIYKFVRMLPVGEGGGDI